MDMKTVQIWTQSFIMRVNDVSCNLVSWLVVVVGVCPWRLCTPFHTELYQNKFKKRGSRLLLAIHRQSQRSLCQAEAWHWNVSELMDMLGESYNTIYTMMMLPGKKNTLWYDVMRTNETATAMWLNYYCYYVRLNCWAGSRLIKLTRADVFSTQNLILNSPLCNLD